MLRALKVSYSNVGEGGVAVNCEKNTIFPEHPVYYYKISERLKTQDSYNARRKDVELRNNGRRNVDN